MARNEEKAQSMLNRYLTGKQAEARGPRQRRPYLASECGDLNEADKWRHQILREIGSKVMEIQNAGLGEHRLRDLNDEINKLLREKGHWERRIVELGGPDFSKAAPKGAGDGSGGVREGGKGGGYKYFGAARDLPGVKELFESGEGAAAADAAASRSRAVLRKRINADYYGLRDEDDGVLLTLEREAERRTKPEALEAWDEAHAARLAEEAAAGGPAAAAAAAARGDGGGAGPGSSPASAPGTFSAPGFVAYVPLPEGAEIEARVMEAKKRALMDKYASEGLQREQREAAQMLGKT